MPAGREGELAHWPSYPHEVLAAVLSVRGEALSVLLWKRKQPPYRGRWALPGGGVAADERLRAAITRHLASKVNVAELAHLEQLATHSAIARDPRGRVLATAYLALLPADIEPDLPADTSWHPVEHPPPTAFDHHYFIDAAVERLRAKLSYTNIGFALAPPEFTISQLRDITSAALGYHIGATNLVRVLTRRGVIQDTRRAATSGRTGGRPATLYRYITRALTITDPYAVLKPPRTTPTPRSQ